MQITKCVGCSAPLFYLHKSHVCTWCHQQLSINHHCILTTASEAAYPELLETSPPYLRSPETVTTKRNQFTCIWSGDKLKINQLGTFLTMEAQWSTGLSTSDFQPEGRWFEPGLCHCVVSFIDKKLYPGVLMGTSNIMLGLTL